MFKRLTIKTLLQALFRACFVVLFVVSAVVGLATNFAQAAAGTPPVINYQARVTTAGGTPITAATNMRFVIWDSLSGGACVWSGWGTGTNGCTAPNASQVAVTPVNGVFSIPLGDTTLSSQNALQANIFSDDSRYLEIQMYNGSTYETLSPRKRILSSAYAFNSNMLNGLSSSATGPTSAVVVATDAAGKVAVGGGAAITGGLITLTSNAASTWSTSSGALNLTGATSLNLTATNGASTWKTTAGTLLIESGDTTASALTIDTLGATATGTISISSGIASNGASGALNFKTGNATIGASGTIAIATGTTTTSSTTGAITINTGAPVTSTLSSGAITIASGNVGVSGQSGAVTLDVGTGGTAGLINIGTSNIAKTINIGNSTTSNVVIGNTVTANGLITAGQGITSSAESHFYQGTYFDPASGTLAAIKISQNAGAGGTAAPFASGINGTATGGQTTFAGYFNNSTTGSADAYGIYVLGPENYFSGNVGIGDLSPTSAFSIGTGHLFTINSSGSITTLPSIVTSAALTITAGAASTWGTSTGNLSLQAAGTGTIGNIQIGVGSTGSTTPDYLVLDSTSAAFGTGDPTGGSNGAMYYNIGLNALRCYQNGAWTNCIGAGGAPALSAVTAATTGHTIDSANNAQVWNWSTLTTQTGMTFGGGSAMTTGKIMQIGIGTYVHTAAETGEGMSIIFTDASTLASGTSITRGLDVESTISTSGAGLKTVDAIAADPPTLTGCASGACTWNGFNAYVSATGAAATITQNGFNVTAQGVALGTLNGINIGAITPAGGAENAIAIGGGWDTSITTLANANLTIMPNGSGDTIFNMDADTNIQFIATAQPAADMVVITNAGQPATTAGVSSLQITYVGGAAAVEASAERIDLTGGTTAAGIWNGLRIVQGTVTPGTTVNDIKLETAALTQTTAVTTNVNGISMRTVGALVQNTAAGTIVWNTIDAGTPNITATTGTITADGFSVTNGSITTAGTQNGVMVTTGSITTGGTQNGINIAAAGVGAGSLNGLNIGGITGGASTSEYAIQIGAGWDRGIRGAGALTIDAVGALSLGTQDATSVAIGKTGVTTTNNGSMTVTQTFIGSSTANYFGGSTLTYITPAPLNMINSAAGAMKTQLNLVNTGGGAGAGSAIDYYTYDVTGGTLPGLRLAGLDNSFSADFVVSTKVPGAAGNALAERFRIRNDGNVGIGDTNPVNKLSVVMGAVPTTDIVNISNSGQANVTAGVAALQITYVGGAAAVEASGARIDITGGTTAGAGAVWNGLRLTQGATITPGTTIDNLKFETSALTQTTTATTNIYGLYMPAATVGAISQTTAAGTINWTGANITTPATTMNFAGGTILNDGIKITQGNYTATTANAAVSGGMNGIDIAVGVVTPATGVNSVINGIYLSTPAHSLTTTGTANIGGFNLGSAGTLTQSTNAGTISWAGLNVTMPNIVQTTGAINTYGLRVANGTMTTGGSQSSVYIITNATNAGTQYGVNIVSSGIGSGSLTGVNIGNITAGAGTENAINIGTGWDNGINFAGAGSIGTTTTSAITFKSAATTGVTTSSAFVVTDSSLTSGTLLYEALSGTTSIGLDIETAAAMTAGGGIKVGLTGATGAGSASSAAAINVLMPSATTTSGLRYIRFSNASGTEIGSLNNASATSMQLTTTSDARLKSNVVETHYTLADLMKIGVRDFTWNADGKADIGFIAQQLYTVYPNAVLKGDNGTDPYVPGVTNVWQIDYSKLTPILVKAIQDQQNLLGGFTVAGADLSTLITDVQAETPVDAAGLLTTKISTGVQFLTNLSSARVTALRGYFDETFAKKSHQENLCVGNANGETCVTKEQLDALLAAQTSNVAASGTNTGSATTNASPAATSTANNNSNPVSAAVAAPILTATGDFGLNGFSMTNVLSIKGINGQWSIDEHGVLTQLIKNDHNNPSLFASSSQNVTVTLYGTGHLESGSALVVFTQEQKDVMAVGSPYNVTVTLTGDAKGVYVPSKTSAGFAVTELDGGASSATFDWTVIARRVGYENANDFGLTPDQLAPVAPPVVVTPPPTPVVTAPADTTPAVTTPTDTASPVATTPSTDTTTAATTTTDTTSTSTTTTP